MRWQGQETAPDGRLLLMLLPTLKPLCWGPHAGHTHLSGKLRLKMWETCDGKREPLQTKTVPSRVF